MKAAVVNPIEPGPTLTPAPSQRFMPPEISELSAALSQLEVFHLIGTGGMGAVYKARQIKLDRIVALKVLRPESSNDVSFAQRFNREAQTLARLSHPNIVSVHDFGEINVSDEDGNSQTLFYFVMEYVDGSDLRQIMGAEIPPSDVLPIVGQVCTALQYAHEQGIVHRDIKPENILLDSHGNVKIADFGLAKLASKTDRDYTLTGTHQVMGTPRYMAPEQMEGSRAVDHRADLYSLGVVFYELLTGEIPMGQFAPPSEKSSVDGDVDSVVLKAMAQEPDRRYQSAVEMSRELSNSSFSMASQVPPGPSTILDIGARKALDGIRRGVTGKTGLALMFPGVLALLVSIGSIVAHASYVLSHSVRRGLPLVISSSVVLFILSLILLAFGVQKRRAYWRPFFILIAGSAVTCLNIVCVLDDSAVLGTVFSNLMIGGGLVLMTIAAFDFRIHLADSQKNRPARVKSKRKPDVAHVGFVVPARKSTSQYIAPHFQMLGYMLVEQSANEWTFERGSVFGHMGIDLRKCHTTLTVRTGPRPDGSTWISCGWSVQAFVTGSEVTKLEAEGQSFARAMGVDTVSLTETGSSQNVGSRQSLVSYMGSSSRSGQWKATSHLNVFGILGRSKLDFTQAELETSITTVHIVCLMGAVDVIVPSNVAVEVTGAGVMGVFDHKGTARQSFADPTHTIRLTGASILGVVNVVSRDA